MKYADLYRTTRILVVFALLVSFPSLIQAQGKERPVERPNYYRMVQIDELSIC